MIPSSAVHNPRAGKGWSVWILFFLLIQFQPIFVPGESSETPKANYELAARFMAKKVGKLVFSSSVQPHWLESGERFWYTFETGGGKTFMLVDPAQKTKRPLFDNARLAARLTEITLFPYDARHLPITTIKFVKNDSVIRFEIEVPKDALLAPPGKEVKTVDEIIGNQQKEEKEKGKEQEKGKEADKEKESKTKTLFFEYTLATGDLALITDFEKPGKRPKWASVSPDEKTVVFARNHNLYMMDAASFALALKKADDPKIVETQLTTDGEEHWSYERTLHGEELKEILKDEKDIKDPRRPAIGIVWSRDSRKIVMVRDDVRKVSDLWVINVMNEPRPELEAYRYPMPGEANMPQFELLVLNLGTKAKVKIKADKFKDQTLSIATAPWTMLDREKEYMPSPRWLSDVPDTIHFTRHSRDLHKVDVCVADAVTGEVRVLIEERMNTYIDGQGLRLVPRSKEMIHWSERDGWGHYYLYDENGRLKNRITGGEFTCQGIAGIDEANRALYFQACGREPGEDPYYMHLYRINFDGTGLKLLNPGNFNHTAVLGDSRRFFIENFSRVDTAPKSVLRDNQGNAVMDLETTDLARLVEAGFKFPEPFTVKAADGITDIYGVMYKPFDFDPAKRYPIIAYVYPGPQTEAVTKTFTPQNQNVALAQFGFVVIEVGNRGGHPQRSKWYHNYGYGNLRDYGLADKKTAIEQLAARHPFIDIDRVGIYGHSGGGFMSTAAMLVYPDFFKVAVSSSGNHENNIYNKWWSERHHGIKEVVDKDGNVKFEYNIEKNSEIAGNLKGRLLLVTGDMDDNVHPGATLRMAAALIKANKRFDFFTFPGQRHGYSDMNDYFFWLRADYFCRHLIGESDTSVDIDELNLEREQGGIKKPGK